MKNVNPISSGDCEFESPVMMQPLAAGSLEKADQSCSLRAEEWEALGAFTSIMALQPIMGVCKLAQVEGVNRAVLHVCYDENYAVGGDTWLGGSMCQPLPSLVGSCSLNMRASVLMMCGNWLRLKQEGNQEKYPSLALNFF